jgi:hypothetical protein
MSVANMKPDIFIYYNKQKIIYLRLNKNKEKEV